MAPSQSSRSYSPWAIVCSISLLAAGVAAQDQQPAPSIPLAYCASVNTNNGFKPFHSDFQSEGRCKGNCTTAGYALGVIQQKDCWCSNTAPSLSDQKPLSDCYIPCPGYPPDSCGGKGAFAYLLLGEPSSTDGDGAAPSTTSVSTSAKSVVEETHVVTTTETRTVKNTVEDEVSPSPPVTSMTSESPTLESPSTTTGPLVQTVTVGGTVRTVTATPSSTAPPAALAEAESGGGGLATGAAVGIAVGVIAALAVAGVFLWMWCIKRKRREEEAAAQYGTPSVHGSSGMLGTPKTAEVVTNPFSTGASDASDAGIWDANGKRRSHLMPIDPRLDPFAKGIYVGSQNKSHESISSLQDNQDYSRRVHQPPRVLRAVNPDPEDD